MKIGIFYFRTLYTQSAASLSVGKLSNKLLHKGYEVKLFLLNQSNVYDNIAAMENIENFDYIIYKCNYKDYEIGANYFKNLYEKYNKKIYLTGVFACLNKKRIEKKHRFFEIFNLLNDNDINLTFPSIGPKVKKDTVICNIDREIELSEHGKYINIELNNGCIKKCEFCHINLLNYTRTSKSISELVDEIEYLIKCNKTFFIFNDCIFWSGKQDDEKILAFCKEVKKRKLVFSFYVYLSLAPLIPDNLLKELKDIGLVRVFFGVENISSDFSSHYSKFLSTKNTENMIKKLDALNISYHIGYILFYKQVSFQSLLDNLKYLKSLGKLFRLGIIIEKLRILPNTKDAYLLTENKSKIDMAYNYSFDDKKVEKAFNNLTDLFNNINIRNFEQFFNGISLAECLLKRYNKYDKYKSDLLNFYKLKKEKNNKIYKLIIDVIRTERIEESHINALKTLYSKSEINYLFFFKKLMALDFDVFSMIPHGQETLNVW